MTDLVADARALMADGKGFLANDEKVPHATQYLGDHGISGGPEMRRLYHNLFIGTPGIETYLSGVILSPDSLLEKGTDKKLFPKSLAARGIATGVTVDEGAEPFPGSQNEFLTQGLIGLSERLATLKKQGAVFTKWRAAIRVEGTELPTAQAIHENAKRLASYAHEVQAAGLIPVLEPEILFDGRHSRTRAKEALEAMLGALFSVLEEHSVDRASVILKSSMALTGSKSGKKDTPEEVAESTLEALLAVVPRQIAGIVFLSGGQTPEQATLNLRAIQERAKSGNVPWPLSFSFARALQDEALSVWKGKPENVAAARGVFLSRLQKLTLPA